MNIGIDIRNIGKKRTGDEVVFFNIARNLAQIDNGNEYYLFTDITDTAKLEDIARWIGIKDKSNFRVISLKTKNRFTWNFWSLPQYLRKNPVDVYLTQYITPFFIPKKIRIATIIHDVSFKAYSQFIKFSDLFFLNILIPLSLKRADRIIGVSKFTASEIIKYYKINPEKVDWLHNAVGDNFFAPLAEVKLQEVREKYKLPEKFILYVGTLQPRKNLPTLIEAYAQLPEEIKSETKLVLAGGKGHNYDTKIDESIKKYSMEKNVIFPGFVPEDDKPTLFKISYAFCNPSFYEGFGITILEAMSLGIPVAASRILPHEEVAGDSILFFNPAVPAELTESLKLLCLDNSLRLNLSQKELQQAKNFSWPQTALKLFEILKKIHE